MLLALVKDKEEIFGVSMRVSMMVDWVRAEISRDTQMRTIEIHDTVQNNEYADSINAARLVYHVSGDLRSAHELTFNSTNLAEMSSS